MSNRRGFFVYLRPMSRYDLNDDDLRSPWWAKVLLVLVVAAVGAVWHRVKTGQW